MQISLNFMFFISSKSLLVMLVPWLYKTSGEVNISHENTTMVVWIYDGV